MAKHRMTTKYATDEEDESLTSTKRGAMSENDGDSAQDEVKAIQQQSQLDNRRIRVWRVIMLMVILATAVSWQKES